MTTLTVTTRPAAELAVDTLVVGAVASGESVALAPGHGLPRNAVVHLEAVLADLEATGAVDEVHRVVAVPGVKATSVVVTGLGSPTAPDDA
ncbi:MAG: M17 family peptidase N-terminal domain-containing protein, partial [Phycicoccus sp.]